MGELEAVSVARLSSFRMRDGIGKHFTRMDSVSNRGARHAGDREFLGALTSLHGRGVKGPSPDSPFSTTANVSPRLQLSTCSYAVPSRFNYLVSIPAALQLPKWTTNHSGREGWGFPPELAASLDPLSTWH